MATTPRLITRYTRQVELTLRNNPAWAAFQVGAARTLDIAYAGTTAMFQIPMDGDFRSPSIRSRRLGINGESRRGLSTCLYDPQDYWVAAGDLPPDTHQSYVRVSGVDDAGNVLSEGPILIVPPPGFFCTPRPRLSIAGTAPSLITPADFTPPVGALHIVLPRFADYVDIYNKEASGGTDMYFSFGQGTPGLVIPPVTKRNPWDAAFNEIYIWGDGGTVEFDMGFAIVNGEMA